MELPRFQIELVYLAQQEGMTRLMSDECPLLLIWPVIFNPGNYFKGGEGGLLCQMSSHVYVFIPLLSMSIAKAASSYHGQS